MESVLTRLPCALGTKLYEPVFGTPCVQTLEVTKIILTKKGWALGLRYYYTGHTYRSMPNGEIPVDSLRGNNLFSSEDEARAVLDKWNKSNGVR